MWLNDMSSDESASACCPYVTRLACADTPEIEKKRAPTCPQHAHYCGAYIVDMGKALEVLDGALAIGRQADLFAADEVHARSRQHDPGLLSWSRPPRLQLQSRCRRVLFDEVKSWFSTKETA
jgi:hypothetical protein